MRTLIIVSHPKLEQSNTQQFLKESAAPLDDVTWYHLDAQTHFDVQTEATRIQAADRLIFQFPLYWYSAPASLKLWLDTVWLKQVAYNESGGLLQGKELGFVISFSQPLSAYQIGGAEGFSVSELLTPYRALSHKTGLTLMSPLTIPQFDYQTEAEHQALLVRYQQYLTVAHPQRFNERAEWFLTQLQSRVNSDSGQLLVDQLMERQEQLERLQMTLGELKTGESE